MTSLITSLLEKWRDTLDPAVGLLLETYAASQPQPLEDLPLKKTERAARLAELSKTASNEERSSILLAFEAFARDASGALVWPAVEAWAEVEEDPRVARMALRTLITLEHQLTAKLWRRLVGCVERHGDRGVAQEAAGYFAALEKKGGGWGFSVDRFANVLRKLEARARGSALSAAELQKFEVLAKSARPATNDDAAEDAKLVQLILANPDDDGARAVYADWLLERRSPRGEFIALQLNRATAKATQRKREAQLLASHRKVLLGALDGFVALGGTKFERGFLVEAVALTRLPVTPLTRLLRVVKFKEGVGKGVDFAGLEEAHVTEEFTKELFKEAPGVQHVTLNVDLYAEPGFEKLRLPPGLRTLTVTAPYMGSLVLTREGSEWTFDVRIEGERTERVTRMASDLLAAVKLKPATTVCGKAGQRKTFEPALNAVLANRSRSFAWKLVR